MKKPIIILLLLLFSVVYFMGLLTQRPPLPFSKDFFSVETPPSDGRPLDLKTVWPVRGKNAEGNEFLLSTQELDKIYELQLDRGIRNYPLLSSVLVREAERARGKGKMDRAVEFAGYAVKFAPELSQPYFELAKVRWSQNPLKPYEAISECLERNLRVFSLLSERSPFLLRSLLSRFQRHAHDLHRLWNCHPRQISPALFLRHSEKLDPGDWETAHQQFQNPISFHPVLPPPRHVMGLAVLVYSCSGGTFQARKDSGLSFFLWC